MEHRTAPHAAPSGRWIPLLVALAWLAGVLAPQAHMALVRHVRCAVHHALEHGGHAAAAAPAEGERPEGEGPRVAPDGGEGSHEACGLVAWGERASEARVERPVRGARLPARPPAAPQGGERALRPEPLVRLAPKHSPPA